MTSGYLGLFNDNASVTILSGATLSSVLNTGGFALVGIFIPPAFTGTTLTFQSFEPVGAVYYPIYNSAGALSYTVAPSRFLSLNPDDFLGVKFLRIVSGTAEGANRTLICTLKGL